jgi:hypothetical protein
MLRKPRLIILNVPEDISTTKTEDSILKQNPGLCLKKGSIAAKFTYVRKKMYRNAVVEVGGGADTRKTLLHRKIKVGWQICRIEDYLVAIRCFKCSKFNHRTQECRGEVTCPLCAGPHTLKDCKGDTTFKCANCANYNKQPDQDYQRSPFISRQEIPQFARSTIEKQTEHRILNGRLVDSNS